MKQITPRDQWLLLYREAKRELDRAVAAHFKAHPHSAPPAGTIGAATNGQEAVIIGLTARERIG